MTIVGQIKSGDHAGSWCLLAVLDALTVEAMTPEERRKLDQAELDYDAITLQHADGLLIRWKERHR